MFTPAYFEHVHDFMAGSRAEEPVFQATTPNGTPVWIVTRYADVKAALADDRLRKDQVRLTEVVRGKLVAAGRQSQLSGLFQRNMLLSDPPDHTRLRLLLARDFTARRIERLRPFVTGIVTALLDELDERTGPVDLVAGFAAPLPAIVISELLGVPAEDRTKFQAWTDALLDGRPEHYLPATTEIHGYLGALIEAKSATPGEDLLSALTRASEDGDRLSADELLASGVLLLVAGHETTTNLLGNGARLLLTEPDLAARLLADPTATVEELLRVESPVMLATQRFTAEPVEISGVTIPEGELVMLALGSANRDADRFERPDEFDLDRGSRGHVAFGHGPHHCLGAPLARLEGEVALTELVRRFPTARLAVPADELRHRRGTIMHGVAALPAFLH
jgi:cytochrome P450